MDLSLNGLIRMWHDEIVPHVPNTNELFLIASIAILLSCLIVIYKGNTTRSLTLRERMMSGRTKERKLALEASRVSDAITAGIENAVHDGHMTRDQARKWYTRISVNCSLPDLQPRKVLRSYAPEAKMVIKEIKARLGNGINKPVNIPGPKPAEKAKPTTTLDILKKQMQTP